MAHLRGGIRLSSSTGRERYRTHTQDLGWEEEQAGHRYQNVGEIERIATGVIGGGLLLRAVLRPSRPGGWIGALIGALLIQRATTGYCAAYGSMGLSTRGEADTALIGRRKVHSARAVKVEQEIVVERPRQELYRFWRQLENLPKVMSHVRSVQVLNERLSHWTVDTLPGGPSVEWDAEIIAEVEPERIGWRTLHGAAVDHAGSVEFQPAGDGGSTRVIVTLQYEPPAGQLGAAVAGIFGQDPKKKIAEDLERFKQTMETASSSSSR